MAEFLIELYVPRGEGGEAACSAARTHRAAESLTEEQTPVRLVRSLFVPDDETCFLLVEADCAEAVRETGRRARLRFERVGEVVGPPSSAADPVEDRWG